MKSRNTLLYAVAAFVVATGLTLALVGSHRGGGAITETVGFGGPVAAGSRAADFRLEALDGHTVSLQSLRGKVVFLNIWATWCGPCREEMPSLETLYDEFKGKPDFVMLAVSQDTRGRAAVEPYVKRHAYNFTVLLDPENQVSENYDVSGVPETFIIDREGRIVAHHLGPFDWGRPDVREALQALLDYKKG